MIYEFIIGKKVGDNYIKEEYSNKWDSDLPMTRLSDAVKVVDEELTKAFKKMDNVPMECTEIKSTLTKLKEDVSKELDGNKLDLATAKFREVLSLFSYFDYEIYLLERPDLKVVDNDENINRAYIIDDHDKVFPELDRVGTGYCVSFDSKETMSPADIIFSLVGRSIRFSQTTTNLLELDDKTETYEKMLKVDAAWQMNVSKIIRFLDDYGYKVIGVLA